MIGWWWWWGGTNGTNRLIKAVSQSRTLQTERCAPRAEPGGFGSFGRQLQGKAIHSAQTLVHGDISVATRRKEALARERYAPVVPIHVWVCGILAPESVRGLPRKPRSVSIFNRAVIRICAGPFLHMVAHECRTYVDHLSTGHRRVMRSNTQLNAQPTHKRCHCLTAMRAPVAPHARTPWDEAG